jgi:DNA-directed RNA polymerase subunit M/transcription elongation factor TFIIS
MDFCKICDNMYYIKLVNETCDDITYYCRKCGNEDKNSINTSKSIVKESISSSVENKINFVNKYTKFDRTLPRINYIKCPNSSCISNTETFNSEDKEIIFIRYDNINMKYLYLCTHCDNSWHTEK